jgi:hypothetical protein
VCRPPDDIVVVSPDEIVLEEAQADGLACVYCGTSGREDGTLVPLRPSVRSASRSTCARTQVAIGHTLPGSQTSRCHPPCRDALLAYEEGFLP